MDRREFYYIAKEEGLTQYNIGDEDRVSTAANVVGYAKSDGWIVYETNERGAFYLISKHSSEEEALDALLLELRNKKRKDEIMKRLRK